MGSRKRNYALDFWKFVFAVIVVLFHSANLTRDTAEQICINGRIGVEFFFIVSGCMMAMSLERSRETSVARDTILFLKRKYFSLMPNAIIGELICFIVIQVAARQKSAKVLLGYFIAALPEALLFKACGLNFINFNGVLWYLSSMLLVMAIIYPIYKRFKELFPKIIAPVAFLFLMGYLSKTYGSLSNLEKWSTYTFKYNIRALADILGGVVCYEIAKILNRYRFKFPVRIMFTVLEWLCFFMSIIYLYHHRPSNADYGIFALFLIAVAITVAQCNIDSEIFRSEFFGWLGRYSYSLYVGHSCWRKEVVAQAFYPAHWNFRERLIAYLFISFISGLFIMYSSIFVRKLHRKIMAMLIDSCLEGKT